MSSAKEAAGQSPEGRFARLRGRAPEIFFAFCFALAAGNLLRHWSMPIEQRLCYMPDDAFYYLQVACRRASEGVWSFDGEHPTTGFHIAWAVILASARALGAADKAGLREGDTVVGWKIDVDPDEKTVLQVLRDDRVETISYYPRGERRKLLQFSPAK